MNLSELQDAVYSYVVRNPFFAMLIQFSKILVLLYPIYMVLCKISFLNELTIVIGYISVILYMGYIIGIILCFAKKDMLYISSALLLRAIVRLISIIQFSFSLNNVIGMVLYAMLAWMAFNNKDLKNTEF